MSEPSPYQRLTNSLPTPTIVGDDRPPEGGWCGEKVTVVAVPPSPGGRVAEWQSGPRQPSPPGRGGPAGDGVGLGAAWNENPYGVELFRGCSWRLLLNVNPYGVSCYAVRRFLSIAKAPVPTFFPYSVAVTHPCPSQEGMGYAVRVGYPRQPSPPGRGGPEGAGVGWGAA